MCCEFLLDARGQGDESLGLDCKILFEFFSIKNNEKQGNGCRCDTGNARSLADRSRADAGKLFKNFSRKPSDFLIGKSRRDSPRFKFSESLDLAHLSLDIPLIFDRDLNGLNNIGIVDGGFADLLKQRAVGHVLAPKDLSQRGFKGIALGQKIRRGAKGFESGDFPLDRLLLGEMAAVE